MKKLTKRDICLCVTLISIILLLVCESFGASELLGLESESFIAQCTDMILTRALGGAAFLSMLINLGYRVLCPIKKPFFRSLLISLPAFLIAVNNFPFSVVISGRAGITMGGGMILLLFAECMCVAFFEETAFRGVVFLGILKRKPDDKLWAFASIAISSMVFGLVHLINLFESSPVAVLMQIGYSALIGAMCSVVLIRTANIWLCVFIHGLFNFSGAVIPRCGEGEIWDTFTVVLTVIVSLLVTVYMVNIFIFDKSETVKRIYKEK